MHAKDTMAIRIGVTVAAAARKHHLTAGGLLVYLKQIFPAVEEETLRRAAAIGVRPLAQ